MASAMTTLMSLSRLMPFLRPRYTVTPASRALTNRIAISSPNEGVMPNTRASAASTVGREMHMVTAVQNSRPRMKNTSTRAQAPYESTGTPSGRCGKTCSRTGRDFRKRVSSGRAVKLVQRELCLRRVHQEPERRGLHLPRLRHHPAVQGVRRRHGGSLAACSPGIPEGIGKIRFYEVMILTCEGALR